MDWQENFEDEDDGNWLLNWDRRRRMAVAQVLCYVVFAMYMRHVDCPTHLVDQSRASLDGKKRMFEGIREAIKDVAEAIREGNDIIKRGQARVYSEEEVFAELVKMGVIRSYATGPTPSLLKMLQG